MLVLVLFECVQTLSLTTNGVTRPTMVRRTYHPNHGTWNITTLLIQGRGARLSYHYYATDTYSSCSKPPAYIARLFANTKVPWTGLATPPVRSRHIIMIQPGMDSFPCGF